MFSKCTIGASLLLVLAASPALAQSTELGLPTNCHLVDLLPNSSFTLGATSTIQIDAGPAGLEGFYYVVFQEYGISNVTHQMGGITGELFIDATRTTRVFALGGPMTGGANPGRSVPLSIALPNLPIMSGVQIIVQAYVTNWNNTLHSFTSALLGTLK